MTFNLLRKSSGRINTTFHITDAACTVVGSANIPIGQEADFQKCWQDGRGPAAAKPGVPRVRLPAMSKAAILRGS